MSALYLHGDWLVVIRSHAFGIMMPSTGNMIMAPADRAALYSYNVSDPSRPVLEHQASASGWHHGSRMVDGTVYAVVQESIWTNNVVSTPVVTGGDWRWIMPVSMFGVSAVVLGVASFRYLRRPRQRGGEGTEGPQNGAQDDRTPANL